MYNYYNHQEIIKVSGENGAKAYQLPPNSSALLLDLNEPIVWLAQTDGAGYKTVTPYAISPIKPKEEVTMCDIEARLKKLEEVIYESNNSKSTRSSKQSTSNGGDHESD